MKKHLLLGLIVAGFAIATAGAQAQTQSQTFAAPAGQHGQHAQRRGAQPQLRRGPIGAFARVGHHGNPLQLLNPAAPAKYFGPPQDTVTVAFEQQGDPYTRSQITGLVLLGIAW